MTSQIMDMDELKAEAKSLDGFSGWQAIKDPEKLRDKIDAFKQKETPVKKKAPKMTVQKRGVSSREDVIARLEEEDPDCKYLTQSARLTPAEAAAKGFEIVRKKSGEFMTVGNDIIVRTDKESYNEWQNARTEGQLQAMKSIDRDLEVGRGGKRIQALTESPKKGV
jgi:hypothetical protein